MKGSFCLRRLRHLPPDMMMSLAEQIEPSDVERAREALVQETARALSHSQPAVRCVVYVLARLQQLRLHLHEQHAETLQETLHIKRTCCNGLCSWTWVAFVTPAAAGGRPLHECVSLSQLAIVATDFHWQLILPWTFSSVELSAVLGAFAATCRNLQKVTMAIDDKELSSHLG